MSDTPPDYIRAHKLPVKYGFGLLVFALAIIAGVINGDAPSVIALKASTAVPFAIAWLSLPQVFNAERSKHPFTPSFIERTLLEGLLIICAVGIAGWTPERQPLGMAVATVFGVAVYFAAVSAIYSYIARSAENRSRKL